MQTRGVFLHIIIRPTLPSKKDELRQCTQCQFGRTKHLPTLPAAHYGARYTMRWIPRSGQDLLSGTSRQGALPLPQSCWRRIEG